MKENEIKEDEAKKWNKNYLPILTSLQHFQSLFIFKINRHFARVRNEYGGIQHCCFWLLDLEFLLALILNKKAKQIYNVVNTQRPVFCIVFLFSGNNSCKSYTKFVCLWILFHSVLFLIFYYHLPSLEYERVIVTHHHFLFEAK